MLAEDRFNNIGIAITNNEKDIDLNLIDESRKKMYKETLGGDDNVKEDLNVDIMDKSIYVFSQIKYIKTKTYRRYIYIDQ